MKRQPIFVVASAALVLAATGARADERPRKPGMAPAPARVVMVPDAPGEGRGGPGTAATLPVRLGIDGDPSGAHLVTADGAIEARLRLIAARWAGTGLPIDGAAAPRLEAGGLTFDRGLGITEIYAPNAGAVEQSFVLEQPLGLGPAELALEIEVEVNGAPAAAAPMRRGGLRLTAPDGRGISYGAVWVVDAGGRRFRARLAPVPGGVRIVLPDTVLAQAAWPITIDPFIDILVPFNRSFSLDTLPDTEPDLAQDTFSPTTDAYLVAWSEEVFPGDRDIHYQIVSANPVTGIRGPALASDQVVGRSTLDERRPRVAFLNTGASDSVYAIVFERDYGGGDVDVVAQLVDTSGIPVGAEIPVATTFDEERNPAIGADPATGQFLIVWEHTDPSAPTPTADIEGMTMDAAGNVLRGPFTVSAEGALASVGPILYNPSNQRNPAVSARPMLDPQGFSNNAWVVVYEDDAFGPSPFGGTDTDIVGCFVSVTSTAVVGHFDVSLGYDPEITPDVAMGIFTNGALVAWEDLGDVMAALIVWDGIGVQSGLATFPVALDASPDVTERPAVAHKFLFPNPGDPFFQVVYARTASALPARGESFIEAVDLDIDFNSGDLLLIGDELASRGLGLQTRPRAQWNVPVGLTDPEEDLIVRSANPFGNPDVLGEQFSIPVNPVGFPSDEDFENTSIPGGATGFPWTTSAAAPWTITSTAFFAGGAASGKGARAASNGNDSTLSLTLESTGPGFVSFTRQVSLDPFNEALLFSIDGLLVGYWSGSRDFALESFAVPTAGTHTYEWKLFYASAPLNPTQVAVIDDVSFPPLAPPAIVDVVAAPTSPVAGKPVSFAATTSGVASEFSWDFGDGTAAVVTTSAVVSHAYAAAGTYVVGLTVTGPGGSAARPSAAIITPSAPPPAFTVSVLATPAAGNAPLSVTFTASTANGTALAFDWDFGDGTAVTRTLANTVKHTYAAAGSYLVTCVATGNGIGASGTTIVTASPPSTSGGQPRPSGRVGAGGNSSGCACSAVGAGPGGLLPLAALVAVLGLARRRRRAAA
jgi:MYXO-CTERM domain-containing protein